MDFEDEDYEEQEYVRPPNPTLEFKLTPDEKIKSKTLCIGFYGVSSLFATTLVNTQKPHATVNFQRSKQRSLASIYLDVENSTAFLIFNENFEAQREIHLSQFVSKNFECENIILFSSKAKGLMENSEGSNCQYISSSFWKEYPGVRFNEGFSGPEAEMLAWAEVNKKPLICFIGIFSDYELNTEIIDSIFGKLNGQFGLSCKNDIRSQIKKYNMAKYANKVYL